MHIGSVLITTKYTAFWKRDARPSHLPHYRASLPFSQYQIMLYYIVLYLFLWVDYIQRWGRPNILYYIILWMSCAPTGTASIGFQSQCNSYKHGLIYVCVFMHNTDLNGRGAVTKSTAAGAVDQYSLSWTSSCLSRPDSAGACTLCQQVMSFILWLL